MSESGLLKDGREILRILWQARRGNQGRGFVLHRYSFQVHCTGEARSWYTQNAL